MMTTLEALATAELELLKATRQMSLRCPVSRRTSVGSGWFGKAVRAADEEDASAFWEGGEEELFQCHKNELQSVPPATIKLPHLLNEQQSSDSGVCCAELPSNPALPLDTAPRPVGAPLASVACSSNSVRIVLARLLAQ